MTDHLFSQELGFSYGEVGHDPPVHAVAGPWQGAATTTRANARNVSLCGRKLSRVRKNPPELPDLCRRCEDLMGTPRPRPEPPAAAGETISLMRDYAEQEIPFGLMFVDEHHGVQRPIQHGWVKKIAATFSWATFNMNPPKLSARADGRYHIMDGQHQVEAARVAGSGPETMARCYVWHGLSFEQEARLFVKMNRDRHAVRPLDLFKADVTSGKDDAVALDIMLDTYGWRTGSSGREGNFAAVTTLRRIYGKPGGPEVCEKIIATITAAWDRRADSANRTIVSALGAFYEAYRAAKPDRLAQVLRREYAAEKMHVWAHEPRWQQVAVVRLQGLYDSGLKDPRRRLVPPS